MKDRRYGTPEARAAADAARNRRLIEAGGMRLHMRLDPEAAEQLRMQAATAGMSPSGLATRILVESLTRPA